MPMRWCLSCGQLFDMASNPGKQRCKPCQTANDRQRDQKRGTAAQRGYGADHRKRAAAVLAGATQCCYCGKPPAADDPFVACHVYAQSRGGPKDGPLAAGHRSCNSRAAGKLNRR
jgi:hypothetical protein